MTEVREFNRRMAQGYDLQPWEQGYPEWIDPAALQADSAPYGATRTFADILDLGCGTGALLASAGEVSSGRLVGTDISPKSCALARERLAPFGSRAEIIDADILDLDPDRLGQFDLVYCTGVLFVVPPQVREHILHLVGRCLRPGGAALISYYAGLAPAVRAHLGKVIRAAAGDAHQGRMSLDSLRTSLRRQSHFTLTLRSAFNYFDRLDDRTFFAEMLNGEFESISTAETNRALAGAGIGFATYLGFSGFDPGYSAEDRAIMADRYDLTDGAFRYALFVKPSSPVSPSRRPGGQSYPTPAHPPQRSLRKRVRSRLRHLFWLIFRV